VAAQDKRRTKSVPLPSIEDACSRLSIIEDAIAEQSAKVEAHKRVLAYAEKTQGFFLKRKREIIEVIKEIKRHERHTKRGRHQEDSRPRD